MYRQDVPILQQKVKQHYFITLNESDYQPGNGRAKARKSIDMTMDGLNPNEDKPVTLPNTEVPSFTTFQRPPYTQEAEVLVSGASDLIHDLNELMAISVDDIDRIIERGSQQSSVTSGSPDVNMFDIDASIEVSIAAYDIVSNQKNYLRIFYERYSLWLMAFAPDGPENTLNKILIRHALRTPFLMNAILSITATYEFMITKDPTDESFKRAYLNSCLKHLNSVFESKEKTIQYIEPLILTSLLFVTDTVPALNGSWRAHLRGANDLFKKYVEIYQPISPTIILATAWFASFEFIAVLTNPLGGAIRSQSELDDILSPVLYKENSMLAMQSGFLLPNGFNVFLGMSSQAISLYITYVKISLKIRQSSDKMIDPLDLITLMGLLNESTKYHIIAKEVIILPDNEYYPKPGGFIYMPLEAYGYQKGIVFSWFDISDRLHIHALYLTILINKSFMGLPIESPLVQKTVKLLLSYCYFFYGIDFELNDFDYQTTIANSELSSLRDRRLLMVHSSMLLTGLCSIESIDRIKIELYFTSVLNLGTRSATRSLERLKKVWNGENEVVDYVPYL